MILMGCFKRCSKGDGLVFLDFRATFGGHNAANRAFGEGRASTFPFPAYGDPFGGALGNAPPSSLSAGAASARFFEIRLMGTILPDAVSHLASTIGGASTGGCAIRGSGGSGGSVGRSPPSTPSTSPHNFFLRWAILS